MDDEIAFADSKAVVKSRQTLMQTALGATYADARDHMLHSDDIRVNDELAWMIAYQCILPTMREVLGLPKTQTEFAEWLGRGESWFRQQRYLHGWIDEFIAANGYVGKRILQAYEDEIFEALGQVASDPIPQASADRKTALEILGHIQKGKAKIATDGKNMAVELEFGD